MSTHEIAPGLHRIDSALGSRVNSVYLFVGHDAALLYDTGTREVPRSHVLPALAGLGLAPEALRWIVVSHGDVDHFGGASQARTLFPAAALCCHRDDAALVGDVEHVLADRYDEFAGDGLPESPDALAACREMALPARPDLLLVGGEQIELGGMRLEVLGLAGHSRGSIGIWHQGSASAVVSDAVLGRAVPDAAGAPVMPPTYRHSRAYRATIERLAQRSPEHLLTAHYATMGSGDGLAFLAESEAFAAELEVELRHELECRPDASLAELTRALAPRVGGWSEQSHLPAFAQPLAGHLEQLEEDGAASVTASDGHRRWSLRA